MPATEAQVRANQANAQKSTGPKTEAGKERSRVNALKHGLTGAGVVMPERAAAEVQRRLETFHAELQPSGEVGMALVLRAATMAVRMEACGDLETAAVAANVRQAIDDVDAPEGTDAAEITRLLVEAGKKAMLEPSKEVINLRKYEAAAERSFYRALKELRQLERVAKAKATGGDEQTLQQILGSISEGKKMDADLDELEKKYDLPPMPKSTRSLTPAELEARYGGVDVPITIGKRR